MHIPSIYPVFFTLPHTTLPAHVHPHPLTLSPSPKVGQQREVARFLLLLWYDCTCELRLLIWPKRGGATGYGEWTRIVAVCDVYNTPRPVVLPRGREYLQGEGSRHSGKGKSLGVQSVGLNSLVKFILQGAMQQEGSLM